MSPADKNLLNGKSVLVTRAGLQSDNKLSQMLAERGAYVIEKPVICFNKPVSFADLDRALKELHSFNWIVFASQTAVQSVLSRLAELNIGTEILTKLNIAAVGKSTTAYLKENNLRVDFQPSKFTADCLVDEFPEKKNLRGSRIFWPRTLAGKKTIQTGLESFGATVVDAEAYTSDLPHDAASLAIELETLLTNGQVDVVTFTSSQTVRNFAAILASKITDKKLSDLYPEVVVAAIGPQTAQTALDVYGRADVVAVEYTIEGLVTGLEQFFNLGR